MNTPTLLPASPTPWFRDPASRLFLLLAGGIGAAYAIAFPSLTLYESLAATYALLGGSIVALIAFARAPRPATGVAGLSLLALALTFGTLTVRAWPAVDTFTTLGSVTTDGTVVYRLTFAEGSVGPVRGVEASDFTNAGEAAGCSFSPSTVGEAEIELTVRDCAAGTLLPRLLPASVFDDSGSGPIDPVDADTSITID